MNVSAAKPGLRQELRQLCAALDPAERLNASAAATDRLLSLPELAPVTEVALYAGTRGEADPRSALPTLVRRGVKVLFPRVVGQRLEFAAVGGLSELRPGHRRIDEPQGPAEDAGRIDLIVVPGLGFDPDGMRLGQGGGHYDRLLSRLPARTVRVGFCFDRQVLEHVPWDSFDQPVDIVVTEQRVIRPPVRLR